jgi:hypothetical protein
MNNKGIALPFVILLVVLFVLTPVLYSLFVNKSASTEEVMGTSRLGTQEYDDGVGLYINSKYGTWDLLEYLCKDRDACESSLMSGKRVGSISGGIVENFPVRIAPDSEWDTNEYLKVFVRSAWGSPEREFNVDTTMDPQLDAKIAEIEYEGNIYNVLIVALEDFKSSFSNIAVFSD